MATTTTKALLTNIQSTLNSYTGSGESLEGLRIIRGVLPPQAVFPVAAVLPVAERYAPPFGGGVYKVYRRVNIEVYTRSYKSPRDALKDAMDYAESIRSILQDNYKLPSNGSDTAWNITFGGIAYGMGGQLKGSFLQRAVVQVFIISDEEWASHTPVSTITEPDSKSLMEAVYSTLSGDSNLSAVKTFFEGTTPPIADRQFPAVSVFLDSEDSSHTEAGRDTVRRMLRLEVWSRLYGKEKSLDDNLDVVEALKASVQRNHQWGGKCVRSVIESIDYKQFVGDRNILYDTAVNVRLYCRRSL